MKTWSFNTKSNPSEISKKLESKLGVDNGFVFSMDNSQKESTTFKIRKRILYGWYWAYQNWTIINGKLLKSDQEEKTNVEISFGQHYLIRIMLMAHILIGLGILVAIPFGASNSTAMLIFGGVILVFGVSLWFALQQKFKKDIQKYKTLISEIVGA
tara:strand:- start:212 stop:679 length:468 start_codon:yes stop_codon:yes gene_type:complete